MAQLKDLIVTGASRFIGNIYGTLKGNADTASKLATARTISLTGSVTGSGSFDGSGNLSIATTTNHTHNYAGSSSAGGSANSAVKLDTATAGSTSQPVYFSGGKPVAITGTIANSTSGNAATASKLQTARTISLTGSVTGSGSFDGSGNLSIATTTNHSHNYLPLAGGNMTGSLKSSYVGGGTWIVGTHNASFVATTATTASEGSYYQGWLSGKTQSGAWSLGALSGSEDLYFAYGTDTNYDSNTNTTASTRISSAGKVYGAVWNDYAEFRICNQLFKPGQVVCENNDDTLSISTHRLQPGANIVSDTFGFAIGETDEAKCPIAVSGRVLAYTYEPREEFNAGDAVCAGPNGTVSKMTREEIKEYPERIIGTVSAIPNYETWGSGNVSVDGRIWIKVK